MMRTITDTDGSTSSPSTSPSPSTSASASASASGSGSSSVVSTSSSVLSYDALAADPLPLNAPTSMHEGLLFIDDEENDDPNEVEELVSNELLHLSSKERNDYQEEIHGVRCLAQDETPKLISESLQELSQELLVNSLYSDYTSSTISELLIKKSLQAAAVQLDHNHDELDDDHDDDYSHDEYTVGGDSSYINTNEFRLRFLRCELFDVKKAAIRLIKWLDLAIELFGIYILERPIKLSDFNRKELKQFHKGRYQFLPYRDRGIGRRIVTIFPDEQWEKIASYLRSKILMYLLFTAGYDIDTQRKGVVIIIWYKPPPVQKILHHCIIEDPNVTTVRVSAIHICSPDTPTFRYRRAITTMRIGIQMRSRMKLHISNTPMELQYILQGYGIPIVTIPITYTGKIKNIYLSQWLRLRRLLESSKKNQNNISLLGGITSTSTSTTLSSSSSSSSGSSTNKKGKSKPLPLPLHPLRRRLPVDDTPVNSSGSGSSCSDISSDSCDHSDNNGVYVINNDDDSHNYGNGCTGTNRNTTKIECPYLNDILFRQGSPLLSNAGNRTLRSMIQDKITILQHEYGSRAYFLENQQQQQPNNAIITASTVTSMGSSSSSSFTSNSSSNKRKIVVDNDNKPLPKLTVIADDIVKELRSNTNNEIRFLLWNSNGWWDEITDRKEIVLKVYMLVREYRKKNVHYFTTAAAGSKQPKTIATTAAATTTKTNTTTTTNEDNAKSATASAASVLSAASISPIPITLRPEGGIMMQPQYQQYQQQYQQQPHKVNSGTNTMFQSMVGGTDCTLPSFCNKKQKLISHNDDDDGGASLIIPPSAFILTPTSTSITTTSTSTSTNHTNYNIDDDNDNDINDNIIYGVKFNWV